MTLNMLILKYKLTLHFSYYWKQNVCRSSIHNSRFIHLAPEKVDFGSIIEIDKRTKISNSN